MTQINGLRIHITGIVQGVGFRPFVYNLAIRNSLKGWVRNTSAGVEIEVEGEADRLAVFTHALQEELPPLARIDTFSLQPIAPNGHTGFEIHHSESIPGAFIPISPDVSICPDCLRELFDPANRRYRYPFINCTHCGPRFTIIEDIPYDRPKTTMKDFPLCPACAMEYQDPSDRRFHAQPVACADCGPSVWLEMVGQAVPGPGQPAEIAGDEAILAAQSLLAEGKIIAIKGLGGFHLACDATNPQAVSELRQRKLRVDKPFALMMADSAVVETHCILSDRERSQLEARQRPIVILRRKPGSPVAAQVAPGQTTIGVMLPYTPLHYLLLATHPLAAERPPLPPLVMTSGNLSDEPIAIDNFEARTRLASLCDAFLMHNRPIRTRCDDSVVNAAIAPAQMIRRSRGYAPDAISLPFLTPPLLAAGAELKNAFCLGRERYAFLSHHIGDVENFEALQSFEDGVSHFERLFRIQPKFLAYDLHPNYLATRYILARAESEGLPALGVQHHHAHIAACLADNGLEGDRPVLGVAFDGTGYGADGAIWGGEFLLADYAGFQRLAHLAYAPLPGGDAAARQPWRIALAWLRQAGLDWETDLPPLTALAHSPDAPGQVPVERRLAVLRSQLEKQINTPLTSSMGRLFDAVAALIGVRQAVNYEAQAAIELEALVDDQERGWYPVEIKRQAEQPDQAGQPWLLDPAPLFHTLVSDLRNGVDKPILAARFHNSLVEMTRQTLILLRQQTGLHEVALSGGVWQNMTLLAKTLPALRAEGFTVYTHRQAPANDGGIALGQMAAAAFRFKQEKILGVLKFKEVSDVPGCSR